MRYLKKYKIFEAVEKLYHGNRKGDFPPEKKRFANAIFLTTNLDFARQFRGNTSEFPNGGIWQVELKENLNLCNPMDPKTMLRLDILSTLEKMINDKYKDPVNNIEFKPVSKGFLGYDPDKDSEFEISSQSESAYHYLWRIKHGSWRIIETAPIIESIKNKYDGFYVFERGVKNVAIFDEKMIKSFFPV